MTPIVSVIIPTYNHAHWLGEAIRSVLDQTFSNFEIVVVDDGSTDETEFVVRQFADKRIKYFYQKNKGLAAARNTGIKASRGEFLSFLDADDVFLPTKLAVQVSTLQKQPEIAAVLGGWEFVDENGRLIDVVEPWIKWPRIDTISLLTGLPFVVHGMLFQRRALDMVGWFDEDLAASEDWDLLLRISALKLNMEWSPMVACQYRIHDTNMTRADWRLMEKIKVLDKFFSSFSTDVNIPENIKKTAYAQAWLQIANGQYVAGLIDKGRISLNKALDWDPTLVDGKPPFLINVFRNWALEPRVSNPIAHVHRIFDHLPENIHYMNTYRRYVLAEVHVYLAFRRYTQGLSVSAHAIQGMMLNPRWIRNRGLWAITAKSVLFG